jgi:hypothetical protein
MAVLMCTKPNDSKMQAGLKMNVVFAEHKECDATTGLRNIMKATLKIALKAAPMKAWDTKALEQPCIEAK